MKKEICSSCKGSIRKGPTVKTADGKPFTMKYCPCTDELNAIWNQKIRHTQTTTKENAMKTNMPKPQSHTPTPWKISNYRPYNLIARHPAESTYEIGDDKFKSLGEIQKPEDAAFIVRAVNAYAPLIEALKEVDYQLQQQKYGAARITISDALALAEGGK